MPAKNRKSLLRKLATLGRGWNWSLAILISALCTSSAFAQWPSRGGPNGNYSVDAESLKGVGAAWSARLGVSDSESIVDGDSVILTALDYTDSGLDATRVLCLNRHTGQTNWSVILPENSYESQDVSDRYPVRPMATPYLFGDNVVCIGYGGSVRCLDKRDGACRWELDLVKEYNAEPVQYGFATSPWGDGKQVLIACGGSAGTILSVDLSTGKVNWSCGTGQVSYCSFVEFSTSDGKLHIVYAAQDELIAVDPANGTIAWQHPYPKKGLTNAVTPIAVEKGKLLVAGQGFEGTRLLDVIPDERTGYRIEEVWKSAKQQPFYCNWVQLQTKRNLVAGFAGKTLFTLDWQSGIVKSQSRGWTDCNLVATPEGAIVVRGDGYVGQLEFSDDKPVQVSGFGKIRDRVWCAPTIVGGSLFVRGRIALHCVPLSELQNDEPMRNGTAVTSMEAMYGTQPEGIAELIGKAKNSDNTFRWEDYAEKSSDDSVLIGEGTYVQILNALAESQRNELGLRIATDWVNRQPLSIRAFQEKVSLLRKLDRETEANQEEMERLVEVEFVVTTQETLPPDATLILMGNSSLLGNWENPGLKLVRDSDNQWRAQARIPRGDLQFKVASGSVEKVEVGADGSNVSNRRFRVQAPCEILAKVDGFKEAK
jgi:outer membrane protein assembly factor BamB